MLLGNVSPLTEMFLGVSLLTCESFQIPQKQTHNGSCYSVTGNYKGVFALFGGRGGGRGALGNGDIITSDSALPL